MSQSIGQNRTANGDVTKLADMLVPERNSFAALRLALAVAVLASHSYWLTSGTTAAQPLMAVTGHSLSEHAVQVFFFVSGLLVTRSLMRAHGIADFAAARALRILPALLACVLLTALALGPWLSTFPTAIYYRDPTLVAYISKTSALMTASAPLPGLFAYLPVSQIVNSPLWSLKYEVMCYGGLALLGFAGLFDARWRSLAAAALALAVACLFIDAPHSGEASTSADNLRYFALYFGVGVLAFLMREHIEIVPALLLPLGSVFMMALGTRWADAATALFLGYATLVVGALDLGWLRRATNDTDLSYGVYVYAFPIQQAMLQLYPGTPALPLTLAALALVMPIAGLSWSLIEQPALGLRRRLMPASAAPLQPVPIERALRRVSLETVAVEPPPPAQHVMGPISARLAAMRAAERAEFAARLPRLPRRDWRYARRRIPQTRSNRLMADVNRYVPSRRARIRARLRPVYPVHKAAVMRFRPHPV